LPTGVHDLLLIRTCLRGQVAGSELSDDWTSCAALLVLDPDSRTRQRLRALRAGFQSCRVEVIPLSHLDEIRDAVGSVDACIDLVVWAKGGAAGRLNTLTDLFPTVPGLRILLSDQTDISQGQSGDGSSLGWQCVVHDAQKIEAAVAIFQMLACLHAPTTFNCLDHEDIEALFEYGARVVLVRGTWFDRQLIFTDADSRLIAHSKHAVYISDEESWTEFLDCALIANSIRSMMVPGAKLFSFSSDGFLWHGWPTQARTVNVMCAIGSSVSVPQTDAHDNVQ